MHFMAGPTHSRSLGPLGLHSTPHALCMVLLTVLVVMSLVFGKTDPVNQEPPYPAEFPKYLRCYRCLLETKELGCLLGSDICLASPGSSCMTLFIKNSKLPSVCLGPRTESLHFLAPTLRHCPAPTLSFRASPCLHRHRHRHRHHHRLPFSAHS
ncbi:PREDICTED: lymphocyte antigen 6 complex locus protein G5c isoform X1 [Myotis brandtii]|uniref:lymphocyte antigen 6 complex locus protein G5c isoform X1 n=1 Tax=Myotis brandtii TaxID=109478 RepID=UPI000703D1E7|nr:PREDICTED: lymphocyte antigen 6 complex locus protein G5c isoform X1 [Myotis brandtii]